AGFIEDGGRLAPDQLGAAAAEAAITAVGQFVGPAIEGAVAAFHRLHTESVAGAQRADGYGLKKRGEVVAEAEIELFPLGLGGQFLDGMELEEVCQGDALNSVRTVEAILHQPNLECGENRRFGILLVFPALRKEE